MSNPPKKIWLFKSYSDQNDINAVKRVLERGTMWINGPEIEEFEERIAKHAGKKYGISFNSGTSGLHANLLAHEIRNGEVIVPSYTFVATVNAVVTVGAKPVFADIEDTSIGLDSKDVKRKITKKTRAIMPIHFAGDVCQEIGELKRISDENNIPLFEDAAHSIGAKLENKPAGSFGDSAIFSFCFNKILTTGEGGMVVTDSEELRNKLKLIRSHGRNSQGEYVTYGFNFRMSSMTAALGLSQVDKLDFIISRRREMASYLNRNLSSIKEISLPIPPKNHYCVFQLYNILVKNKKAQNALKKFLEEKGIPTRITYNPVHLTPYYRDEWGWKEGDLPVTEAISERVLTLPFHLDLDKADLDYIIKQVKNFFRE